MSVKQTLLSILLQFFRLPKSPEPEKNHGLLIIQIDGLSRAVLVEAIERGYCQFFKELVDSSGYQLLPYTCSVPSTTPAVQAELFYGKGQLIPAYSWLDRKAGTFMNGFHGSHMKRMEKVLASGTSPLLKGGSCILGTYSGGATMASFATKDFTLRNPIAIAGKFRLILLPLLSPVRFWSIVFLLLRQLFLSFSLYITSRSWHTVWQSLEETLLSIAICDIGSDVGRIELVRETPKLFINYSLYDHVAHAHGTKHPVALSTLRVIDSYSRVLVSTALARKRLYDIVILSDHGQSEAVPFEAVKGGKLAIFLRKIFGNTTPDVIVSTEISDKLLMNANTVFCLPSGDIANVYFSETVRAPHTKTSLQKLYPTIVSDILSHPGIGWVLVRSDMGSEFFGKNGHAVFSQGLVLECVGEPIPGSDGEKILKEVAHYCLNPSIGDIVLFGDVLFGKTVSFEPFFGVHSGFTGEMREPFIMTKNPVLQNTIRKSKSMKEIFGKIREFYSRGVSP